MKIVNLIAAITGIAILAMLITPAEAQQGVRLPPGDYERTITVNDLERSFLLHIPPGANAGDPVPLVVGLHGLGSDNKLFELYTDMNAKADEFGFIVVYPNGTGEEELAWNAGHCCNLKRRNNVDDVAFIRELVTTTKSVLNVDPDRIYATGMSNGGMLAYRLAAEASDMFAAIGSVAGSIGGQAQDGWPEVVIPPPTAPVSIIAINGMQDEFVRYEGGEAGGRLTNGHIDVSVSESIGFWVYHNDCDPVPETKISFEGNVITDTFSCPDGIDVELITIVDGEHAWPGSPVKLAASLPQPNKQISATDIIFEFFVEHPKPATE